MSAKSTLATSRIPTWTIYRGPHAQSVRQYAPGLGWRHQPRGFRGAVQEDGGQHYLFSIWPVPLRFGQSAEHIAPAINRQDQYLLGWQGGATMKLNETDTIQVAPTIYQYVNNKPTSKTFAGAFSPAN
jgi:hypothetical protein